jgi:hypothetical protein
MRTKRLQKKIIDYVMSKNIKIVKTSLIKFPIYPINWSGYDENRNDYLNFNIRLYRTIQTMYIKL